MVSAAAPTCFALLPNAPHAFLSLAGIRFELAYESPIQLSVDDVLGREVALLARGVFPAGGSGASVAAASARRRGRRTPVA